MKYDTHEPQPFSDIGGQHLAIYAGQCPVCGRSIYQADDLKPDGTPEGEPYDPDPRGVIGVEHTCKTKRPQEFGKAGEFKGPDVRICYACDQNPESYAKAMEHCKRLWTLPPGGHAYQNSNPAGFDSDCAICGGKMRDSIHGADDETRARLALPPGEKQAAEFLSDIPLSVATAAHSGTSFVPERRGESERAGYAEGMAKQYNELFRMCRNDSERATLADFWPRYRAIMRRLHLEALHSKSNVVSWAIAGPSNFPGRRMEKRARWAHNKIEHMLEVDKKLIARIKKDLRPEARPIMAGDSDAVQRLKDKIAQAERTQEAFKAINATIRKHKKAGPEAQVAALVELIKGFGWTKKDPTTYAAEFLKPDFCGRIGIPDYELTNNNANIRRMRQRLEAISEAKTQANTEQECENARIEDCPAENRIRLFFPGKPSAEVRGRLKSSGFRWSPTIGAWQAYRNWHTLEVAKKEAGAPQEVVA